MTLIFLLAAALPGLFVESGPAALTDVKKAGIECVYVAPKAEAAWKAAGACVKAVDPSTLKKLPAPGVQYRMNVGSATNAPWVNTNGWQYVRGLKTPALVAAGKGKSAVIAAAEAHAFGGDAIIQAAPQDWPALGEMIRFLKSIAAAGLRPLANIGFVDDGSAPAGENLNLLLRRNLMTRVVSKPAPELDLNVKPQDGDPSAFAYQVRQKLGDDKRLLRIYGSDVVLVRLEGDATSRRVSLVNYGERPVEGLRVKVLGRFSKVHAQAAAGSVEIRDVVVDSSATEFSLPLVPVYTVIDLKP